MSQLIQMEEIGRLEPNPTFGSLPNWRGSYKSRIVEHLILGVPLEMIWAEQDGLGKIQLLSGFDVISIILAFRQDKLRLTSMRVLKHLEGLRFSKLDYVEQKHFMQMVVPLCTIYTDSDPILKCWFIEKINWDKYRTDTSQIARSIIFKNAVYYLDKFTDRIKKNFHEEPFIKNRDDDRFMLRLQKEILTCLLISYVSNQSKELNSTIGSESYSYSRSHISSYSNHKVDVNLYDDIETALNKIMFMIEVNDTQVTHLFENVLNLIDKVLKKKKIEIGSLCKVFSYNFKYKKYEDSLVESIVFLLTGNTKEIQINSFSSVSDLIYRIKK